MKNERKESFKVKFEKHYPRLCSIAYGYVFDKHEAEDIVQETFINVWNKEKDLLPASEFAAYITTAVKNQCISFLRKRPEHFVSIEEHQAQAEAVETSSNEDNHEAIQKMLHTALSLLPPKCKEIFLMSKQRGMKYRDR